MHPLSKRNALKLLVHFLGDIHQPLHVGCGFIDVNGPNGTILIVKDPAIAAQKNLPHDKGGNDLVIDNDRKNLHSFWDFTLVTNLLTHTGQDMTSDTLGEFLRQSVKPRSSWNTQRKAEHLGSAMGHGFSAPFSKPNLPRRAHRRETNDSGVE